MEKYWAYNLILLVEQLGSKQQKQSLKIGSLTSRMSMVKGWNVIGMIGFDWSAKGGGIMADQSEHMLHHSRPVATSPLARQQNPLITRTKHRKH